MSRATPRTAARTPARVRRRDSRFIVLTGLSGSGKSQAIRALEDLGYFCVDNIPTTLLPTLARLAQRGEAGISKLAVVVDVRERGFLSQFPRVFRTLSATRGLNPTLIFLEASHGALVRRFSETRRPHPLAPDRPVSEGIQEERRRLRSIRRMAHQILDTSDMTVHELRHAFMSLSRGKTSRAPLVATILSFGFKHGLPLDADLVFDVRFLPNPHFVPGLRLKTGRDRAVVRFLEKQEGTAEIIDKLADLLGFLLPQYVREGKSYLTIAIGCTGGRHRSVMVAEAVRKRLRGAKNVRLRIRHRDVAAPDSQSSAVARRASSSA